MGTETSATMKTCVSCKHEALKWVPHERNPWSRRCTKGERSKITGGPTLNCEDARATGGICGPDGNLWEKYKKPPWWRRLFE